MSLHSLPTAPPDLSTSLSVFTSLPLPSLLSLREAIERICRPLLANLYRDPSNEKYHQVKQQSPLLTRWTEALGEDIMVELLGRIGFGKTTTSAAAGKEEVSTGEDGVFRFAAPSAVLVRSLRASSSPTTVQALLKSADAFLDTLSHTIEQTVTQAKWKGAPPLLRSVHDEDGAAAAATQRAVEQIVQQRQLESLALEREARASAEEAVQRQKHLEEDVASALPFVELSRRTIHLTGRLRNASFQAKHYTLTRMTHARSYLCHCPADHLEAHWHVVSGNLLYAYVVHLTADATAVVHTGEEHSYQYDSLPGSATFQKYLMLTVKKVDSETGKLEMLKHVQKAVEVCAYCGVPLKHLFL